MYSMWSCSTCNSTCIHNRDSISHKNTNSSVQLYVEKAQLYKTYRHSGMDSRPSEDACSSTFFSQWIKSMPTGMHPTNPLLNSSLDPISVCSTTIVTDAGALM